MLLVVLVCVSLFFISKKNHIYYVGECIYPYLNKRLVPSNVIFLLSLLMFIFSLCHHSLTEKLSICYL